MIDNYLEKDLLKQIKIVKLLFQRENIHIDDLTSQLQISRNTALTYIQQIQNLSTFDATYIDYQQGKITLVKKRKYSVVPTMSTNLPTLKLAQICY